MKILNLTFNSSATANFQKFEATVNIEITETDNIEEARITGQSLANKIATEGLRELIKTNDSKIAQDLTTQSTQTIQQNITTTNNKPLTRSYLTNNSNNSVNNSQFHPASEKQKAILIAGGYKPQDIEHLEAQEAFKLIGEMNQRKAKNYNK